MMTTMIGVFNQQAYNLILLAEDEARMLGQRSVAPEHLLLALTRRGNVERLLHERDVSASDIHAAIVRTGGLGDDLVLGHIPRSPAVDHVLERAVDVAAERGMRSPGSEHLLLALEDDESASAVLREVGLTDPEGLVDSRFPRARPPLSNEEVNHLLRVAINTSPPRPGPIPPVFERFTTEAQRAVRAASECASLLENHYVEPFHLLLGCLHVPESIAAKVLVDALEPSDMGTIGEAMERARMIGPPPAHQATGIFTDATRQLVAETALQQAYRHGHAQITTGHLLLATLDSNDRTVERIVGSGAVGSGPVFDSIAREVVRALPGDEHALGTVDDAWISLDLLIRIMTMAVAKIVPSGWTVWGSRRSGGISLKVPDSKSEEDFRIDLSWIVARRGKAPERLAEVSRKALEDLQRAVAEQTAKPWPADSASGQPDPPDAHAEIVGDNENPMLRLCYGDPSRPILEVATPPILLTSVIQGH
jgi:hypothetical protein